MAQTAVPRVRYAYWLKRLAIAGGLLLLIVGCVAFSIYAFGQTTSPATAQAAIVLGASVQGEEPSPVFRERINHALVLYREGRVHKLLFTGGLGKAARISEAEVAKRYAVRLGVHESDVFTEDRSHTTLENLRNVQALAHQHQLNSFLIVSDPLHMKRAMDMAIDLGMDAKPSPTPTTRYRTLRSQWGFLLHETYFYLDYHLRPLDKQKREF